MTGLLLGLDANQSTILIFNLILKTLGAGIDPYRAARLSLLRNRRLGVQMPRVWLSLAEGKTKKPQPNWLRFQNFTDSYAGAIKGLNEKRGQKVSYFS